MNNQVKNNNSTIHLKKSSGIASLYDWVQSMLFAISIVIIVLVFFFRLVHVDGSSMNNTLFDGDKVIVSNFMYTPKTGDIVVISHGERYSEPIIKRVIATEGQTLKIDVENQIILVDDKIIDQPYAFGETKINDLPIPSVIPEGKVFVLGDNRENSLDSRSSDIGLIDESSIIGEAKYVIFPFQRFQNLD